MAIRIRSGLTGAVLAVDPTINAARVVIYDALGSTSGKTVYRFALSQVATPGTTVIQVAVVGNRIKLVAAALTMNAAGTVKFSGASDLTGAMDVATQGGFVLPANVNVPWVQTGINEALSIITATGAANGVILYLIEP